MRGQKDARSRDQNGRAQFTCYTAASIGPGNPMLDASAVLDYPYPMRTESNKSASIPIHGHVGKYNRQRVRIGMNRPGLIK
jgi:hypothetical protein